MGILIGVAFMFCVALIPLDMGYICVFDSITCL